MHTAPPAEPLLAAILPWLVVVVLFYHYMSRDDVWVSSGPHIRLWSGKNV